MVEFSGAQVVQLPVTSYAALKVGCPLPDLGAFAAFGVPFPLGCLFWFFTDVKIDMQVSTRRIGWGIGHPYCGDANGRKRRLKGSYAAMHICSTRSLPPQSFPQPFWALRGAVPFWTMESSWTMPLGL